MSTEHAEAVAAAQAHIAGKPDPARPLASLPAGFAATRDALHVVAEQLVKPKRELETGNEIALGFAPGGFGTPAWDRGVASGGSGSVCVDGTDLVLTEGGEVRRAPAGDLSAGAALLGVGAPDHGPVEIDAAGAAALADWYAFGTVLLADLLDRRPGLGPAPIRLWPEHFDVATDLGDDAAGGRANYGASPGDDDHTEPYLYVGPWDHEVSGEIWNSTAFVGAELGYANLLDEDDQIEAGLSFMLTRLTELTTAGGRVER